PLGLSAAYWYSILHSDPEQTTKQLNVPVLVLQGGDDYQVPPREMERWKAILKDKKARFILYPGLGHGFFSSNGIPGPKQYDEVEHVDEQVIRDIRKFIKRGR